MQTVEDIAIATYDANMNFLKKNHESLFNKLSALEILLEDGRYQQKYDLEYKDDYFDVIELKTKNYLYGKNSNNYSDDLTNDITYKKNEQVCETFYNYDFTPSALEKAKNSDATHTHSTIAPIISYYRDYIDPQMHFQRIYKFLFLGLGLALHVPKITNKIDPEIILLVEDDLELFRLSLFTCNYVKALNNCIPIFSIGENSTEFIASLDLFYDKSSILNQYLKFSLFSSSYQRKIKEIQEYIISRPEKCYSHERILHKNQKVLQKIKEKYNFLDLQKKEKESFFDDKPILVVGAGPSLHANINWLIENKDHFIILAVFAALKTLAKHNISPDIVIQLDEKINEGVTLVKSFDNFDFLKNSIFIFSASAPDILFETFQKEKIFLVEDRTYYKQEELQIVASSVGEVAYSVALLFNATQTYLLGLDLALADDGTTHSAEHHGTRKLDISAIDNVPTVTSLQLSTLKVKGNFRDIVLSTPLFATSIPKLNRYTEVLKSKNQQVFNLSDGAFFDYITPRHPQDVNLNKNIDKQHIATEITKIFSKYSTGPLTNREREHIEKRKNQVDEFYKCIKDFENSPTSSNIQFINEYKRMIINIIKTEKSELRELLIVYIYNTANYIIDFFNTKELANPKKHTKKLKKIIIVQFEKIISFYETIINDSID